jgi:hypothetical protein
MKTTLSLCLALVVATSLRAQIFRPEAVNGAVLGGIAGAVIGNNSGDLRHNAWRGAAIGAGAGLILGEAVGNANAQATQVSPYRGREYVDREPPAVRVGIGYGGGYAGHRGHGYGYYSPRYSYGYLPSYGYYSAYGDAYPYYDSYGYYGGASGAANGLVLGALAGGIIGNNSGAFHHNGWRGAAWGAGLGWLLGSVADANRAVVYNRAPVTVSAPAATTPVQSAAQPVTIINNYYNTSTPMSSANSMFGR